MRVARRVAEQPASNQGDGKFAVLRRARRVWAVGAIHGDAERLAALHDTLAAKFQDGDRLVYTGNYLGRGAAITATLDELLAFRRDIIARPLAFASDVAYLRGSQEEMWEKLLQLQFAVDPRNVLDWILGQGVAETLRAYGCDPDQGRVVARDGAMAIGRWTNALRQAMAARPGHRQLMSALRRAAYTDDNGLLFVHAGFDPKRPLEKQGDALWWGHPGWGSAAPYQDFRRVVRGFGRAPGALDPAPYALSIDSGCGFGGKLTAVCLAPSGETLEQIDA